MSGVVAEVWPPGTALVHAATLPALGRQGVRGHICWTPEHDACLGLAPDTALAEVWGIPHQPVWRRRCRLRIPPHGTSCGRIIAWDASMIELLGRQSDRAVARRLGLSVPTVALKRQSLGIAPIHCPIDWREEMDEAVGATDDGTAARELGIARNSVGLRRRRLGKPAFRRRKLDLRLPEVRALLASASARDAARRLGVVASTVVRARRRLPQGQP